LIQNSFLLFNSLAGILENRILSFYAFPPRYGMRDDSVSKKFAFFVFVFQKACFPLCRVPLLSPLYTFGLNSFRSNSSTRFSSFSANERRLQEVHSTRARYVLGPGRMKLRTLNFSVIKPKITSASRLPV